MKTPLLALIISLLALSSCQTQYFYTLPTHEASKRFPPEKMKWEYTNKIVTKVPVIGENNKMYRLDVTPKTKLEALTVYGEKFQFYFQTITVEGSVDGLIGSGQSWTGYELHDHAQRTVAVKEVTEVKIISQAPASELTF